MKVWYYIDRREGFTLVDILITIAVTSMVIALIVGFFINQGHIYKTQEALSSLRFECQRTLEVIEENLVNAGMDPKETGLFGIELARVKKIRYSWDKNMNGLKEENETEEIWYNSNHRTVNIKILSTNESKILGKNIAYFALNYFDENMHSLLSGNHVPSNKLGQIRVAEIVLVGITPKPIPGYISEGFYPDGTHYKDNYGRYFLRSFIKLRNLSL